MKLVAFLKKLFNFNHKFTQHLNKTYREYLENKKPSNLQEIKKTKKECLKLISEIRKDIIKPFFKSKLCKNIKQNANFYCYDFTEDISYNRICNFISIDFCRRQYSKRIIVKFGLEKTTFYVNDGDQIDFIPNLSEVNGDIKILQKLLKGLQNIISTKTQIQQTICNNCVKLLKDNNLLKLI